MSDNKLNIQQFDKDMAATIFDRALALDNDRRARRVVDTMASDIQRLRELEETKRLVELGIEFRQKRITAMRAGEWTLTYGEVIQFNDESLNKESLILSDGTNRVVSL